MGFIGNVYGFLGYFNHSRGKKDKAEAFYEKAMAKGVTNPNYQLAYGVLLLRKGEIKKAQDIFSKLVVYFPKNQFIKDNCKINLALTYWKQGDINTAVEMMGEVHAKLKNSRTYGTYGYLLVEAGDYEKALEFNMEALDYDDTDSVVLDNIGQIYFRMGRMDEAYEYFSKALKVKENQADTLYYTGCIHEQKGEISQAIELWKKALDCNISALSTICREAIEEKLAKYSKE